MREASTKNLTSRSGGNPLPDLGNRARIWISLQRLQLSEGGGEAMNASHSHGLSIQFELDLLRESLGECSLLGAFHGLVIMSS